MRYLIILCSNTWPLRTVQKGQAFYHKELLLLSSFEHPYGYQWIANEVTEYVLGLITLGDNFQLTIQTKSLGSLEFILHPNADSSKRVNPELGWVIKVSEWIFATLPSRVVRVLISSHIQYGLDFISAELVPPYLIEVPHDLKRCVVYVGGASRHCLSILSCLQLFILRRVVSGQG